ncbi:MAG: hypothetical protein JSV89_18940 [Spirochaetaceae bacterium]|nr:MAG: hypothetical protein JSV89_18940 [Spirochaetaceae bacterium]
MVKNIKVLTVAILILCCSGPAFAQEEDGGFGFGLNIGIGAQTFDGTTYQSLKLSPDISFGKFGIGLELTMNYQFAPDFTVRQEDWWPTGDDTFLDVYLPKFKYIRYGFKGEPLYVKFGSIEDALLGNGFIIGGYDNTLFLPEKRIFGLSFDLDGTLFNFPYVGIETFVGNLAQFDVMGIRTYVRPLAFTDVPIINGLQVGGTLALDRKPNLYIGDDSIDPVTLFGADLTLPILTKPMLSLTTFADIAFLYNNLGPGNTGKGEMVGVGGRLARVITYGAQIRVLGEDFIPTYFDVGYDLFRADKYKIVNKISPFTTGIDPYFGWLGSLGFAFLDDALIFKATLDGPFSQPGGGNPDNYLDWPHLYAVFILGEGIVPNLSLEASWDKRSLGAQDGFFRDLIANWKDDTVLGARVNYSIGAAVISVVYQVTYDPVTGDPVTKSGIESAIQLF